MILRRFMQHVKEQNWFAVGLDVIVVIVGIFLGMQVTEWNDERKDRALEGEYINRIIADLDSSIDVNKSTLDEISEQVSELGIAVETIYEKRLSNDNRQEIVGYIRKHSTGWETLTITDDTLEELKSTGNMALIQSTDIRSKIIGFQRKYMLYREYQDSFDEFMINLHEKWLLLIETTPHTQGWEILTSNEDFINNPQYYKLLNQLLSIHRLIDRTSRELDNDSRELRATLYEYLTTLK